MDRPSAASLAQKSLSTKLSSPKSALSSLIRFVSAQRTQVDQNPAAVVGSYSNSH